METGVWKLRGFKPQSGYANMLLDGIWLRGPYLHNGSVPTLADLLEAPEQRPKQFCRGTDVYDWDKVGFVSAVTIQNGTPSCGQHFLFDTRWPGNRNQGHAFGTGLSPQQKTALMAFLKSL